MYGTLVLLALLGASHPIHSSSALLRIPDRSAQAAIELRVFADDFPPGPSRAAAQRYLADRFRVLDRRGATVPLTVEGITVDGAVLILSLSAPVGDGLVRVWHGVLAEKFSDQVNLVRVERGGRRGSLLFVAGDGAKTLP